MGRNDLDVHVGTLLTESCWVKSSNIRITERVSQGFKKKENVEGWKKKTNLEFTPLTTEKSKGRLWRKHA